MCGVVLRAGGGKSHERHGPLRGARPAHLDLRIERHRAPRARSPRDERAMQLIAGAEDGMGAVAAPPMAAQPEPGARLLQAA